MKKNKVFLSLLIFSFLFLATLGMAFGFSLYTIGEVNVEVKQASVTNIAKNSYDNWYADVEIDVDSTHDAKFYCSINIFYEDSYTREYYEEYDVKQGSSVLQFDDVYVSYYGSDIDMENIRIETKIYSIEKMTSTLNYIGYCLFPLSLLIAGFVLYAWIDFNKEKRTEME